MCLENQYLLCPTKEFCPHQKEFEVKFLKLVKIEETSKILLIENLPTISCSRGRNETSIQIQQTASQIRNESFSKQKASKWRHLWDFCSK